MEQIRERFRPWYLRRIYFPLHPERKPSYFDTCWTYPEYHDGADLGEKPVVLFFPMNDWHTRMQRTQQLARAMSHLGHVCVYVNPHLGREFPAPYHPAEVERLTVLGRNLLELHVHLPREPVFHHRALLSSESRQITEAVERALVRLGAGRVVQVVAFPVWLDAARKLRDRQAAPIVYDCHDHLPGLRGVARPILDLEPELFGESDLVVCSSDQLLKRAQEFQATAEKCVLLRNAAASEFFEVKQVKGNKPVIGYAGALDRWFDVASVEFAARSRPEWRFELIGRVEHKGILRLESLPNVEFSGEVPFAQLPGRMARFDVGTIPFLLDPLIEATDPIKVYEYLAAGLPVVSAALPELRRFGDLVDFYGDSADFVAKLEAALVLPAESMVARRATAFSETWERRAEELSQRIRAIH